MSRPLIAAVLVVSACGSVHATKSGAAPKARVLSVAGSVSVPGNALTDPVQTGVACVSRGGYDDVTTGTQVVVQDAEGKTVGVGSLGDGGLYLAEDALPGEARCVYHFAITGVPAGRKFYRIAVGRRGEQQYQEAALAKFLELKVG